MISSTAMSIVSGVNVLLVTSLLYVYIKSLLKIRAGFTFGLVLFALLFLMQNMVMLYFNLTMMPLYVEAVNTYIFIFNIMQTFAFIVLNFVTWK